MGKLNPCKWRSKLVFGLGFSCFLYQDLARRFWRYCGRPASSYLFSFLPSFLLSLFVSCLRGKVSGANNPREEKETERQTASLFQVKTGRYCSLFKSKKVWKLRFMLFAAIRLTGQYLTTQDVDVLRIKWSSKRNQCKNLHGFCEGRRGEAWMHLCYEHFEGV